MCGPRPDAAFEFLRVTVMQMSTERENEKGWQIYLIALPVYFTSGVTSTPPSTTFEMRKTANAVAIASHIVVSAN